MDDSLNQADGARMGSQARRLRLREFQTQLIERMRVARGSTAQSTSQLGVMIGSQRWLLNLRHAGEVSPVGAIQPVPLVQDWFAGLVNLRGHLIGVTDIARFHGLPPTVIDKASRLVCFAPTMNVQAALLVSAVLGLRNVGSMTPYASASSGSAGGGAVGGYIGKRYVDRSEQLWTELDLALLAQDERFLDIGR